MKYNKTRRPPPPPPPDDDPGWFGRNPNEDSAMKSEDLHVEVIAQLISSLILLGLVLIIRKGYGIETAFYWLAILFVGQAIMPYIQVFREWLKEQNQ